MVPTPRTNWSGQLWLMLNANDIAFEQEQARDEGRDLSSVEAELAAMSADDLSDAANQPAGEHLLDTIQTLVQVDGYAYVEPSDGRHFGGTGAASGAEAHVGRVVQSIRQDLRRLVGAVRGLLDGQTGRRGRNSRQIRRYVQAQGDQDIHDYLSSRVDPKMAQTCGVDTRRPGWLRESIDCMVEDDDINYTIVGLDVLEHYGRGFGPVDVARTWLSELPVFSVFSAERVAYRNLLNCVPPPASASLRNVYREWISARSRADVYGYVNPGDPALAAEYAQRDASVSHVKNAIYASMWVAAMLAEAYVCDDAAKVVETGLEQIPARCRLAESLRHVLNMHADGRGYDDALAWLRSRWDEAHYFHWCHTLSNAAIVAIALLWGENDFVRTLHCAIWPGFDTDCNGATSGSVLGVMLGAAELPERLTDPLADTLWSGVAGYGRTSISQLAERTAAVARRGIGA